MATITEFKIKVFLADAGGMIDADGEGRTVYKSDDAIAMAIGKMLVEEMNQQSVSDAEICFTMETE